VALAPNIEIKVDKETGCAAAASATDELVLCTSFYAAAAPLLLSP